LTGGGEPLLERHNYKGIIEHVTRRDAIPVIFTCAYTITPDIAKWLYDHNATIIAKLNSTEANPGPTNELSGRNDAHEKMLGAIESLIGAGFPGDDPHRLRLGVESVITLSNYCEIVPLWCWIRDRGLFPYIELTKLMGRARYEQFIAQHTVPLDDAKRLFEEVAQVDQEKYGYYWEPIPPIMGSQCTCYYCGCYVDMLGQVQPCSGVTDQGLGSVHDPGRLTFIVRDSQEFDRKVRRIANRLNGKCSNCSLSKVPVGCYGCRAHSFWEGADAKHPTYDYFGGDPLCWMDTDRATHLVQLQQSGATE